MFDFIISNKDYMQDFITRSTYHSNAIEGSTLTYAETYAIIYNDNNFKINNKEPREIYEAINHKKALLYVFDNINNPLSESLIKNINKIINQDIKDIEGYRKINDAPLYINTVEGITINEFKERCRNLKLENDIQLIVTSTAIINDTKINVLKTINKLAEELKITILVTTHTIENNNIPLKQELKELVELMNITDITIYLKLGNEEEKGIVHCIVDTKDTRNVIDLIYLTKYNKFVDLIRKL